MRNDIHNYIARLQEAFEVNGENLRKFYKGKDGALRFAREFGFGLNDFSLDQIQEVWDSLYDELIVKTFGKKVVGIRQFKNAVKSELDMLKLMPAITLDEAKQLTWRTELYVRYENDSQGQPVVARVNGKVKTWKTRPDEVQVPLKHGMYDHGYLHDGNLDYFSLVNPALY